MLTISGMTDSEKNDFINFIYGQLKEREAQNEALHAKLDAQMDRFDKLQAPLDAISSQLAESNKMKEVLQKGFDNMQFQLGGMKDELVKTQKELRKSQREAKKYSELTEVEHVCCMAHVRARFQKALEQGKDERARFFFDRINDLYKKEDFYKKNSYPPNKIKEERHDARTTELITEMRMELTRLLTTEDPKSDLLTNALNYFDNSWKQVMAWRNDGRYTIDRSAMPLGSSKNSEAERNIRTMTIERSNSKSFGSNEGVESSAVYHTIIATCKAQAISVCDYLKKFFKACVDGRTDYERSSFSRLPLDLVAWLVQEPSGRKNLTPMMLCQPVK